MKNITKFYVIASAIASIGTIAIAQTSEVQKPAVSAQTIAAKETLTKANEINNNGNIIEAAKLFSSAYTSSGDDFDGLKISMEAAKKLGFISLEQQNIRSAEAYFAAESLIARRLYFQGQLSARAFSDSIGRWASGSGAMGRSIESAALVFYGKEIKARDRANASSAIMKRDPNFDADSIESVKINGGTLCVINSVAILKTKITCEDEAAARTEALSLQTRQILADAPPPPTKEQREQAEAKKKAKAGQ